MSLRVPDGARREIKFVAPLYESDRIRHWLRLHRAAFKTAYPDRWVNNVYFDTHGYTAYAENLSGGSSRTKVRYRWYGAGADTPGPGGLEIKQKRNSFGWKLRFPVPEAPYRPGAGWNEIRRLLEAQLNPEGRLWLRSNPHPVLLNRYYREYYVNAEGRIRVTLDTRQAVWDQRKKAMPNVTQRIDFPSLVTMEMKFDRGDRDLASRLVQGLPVRLSRYSKYTTGVGLLRDR